jgi:hypothetical protein
VPFAETGAAGSSAAVSAASAMAATLNRHRIMLSARIIENTLLMFLIICSP